MLTGLACLLAGASAADEPASAYGRIWSHTELYNNPGGGFLQSLALSGRLQADATWFDTDEGHFTDQSWRLPADRARTRRGTRSEPIRRKFPSLKPPLFCYPSLPFQTPG